MRIRFVRHTVQIGRCKGFVCFFAKPLHPNNAYESKKPLLIWIFALFSTHYNSRISPKERGESHEKDNFTHKKAFVGAGDSLHDFLMRGARGRLHDTFDFRGGTQPAHSRRFGNLGGGRLLAQFAGKLLDKPRMGVSV